MRADWREKFLSILILATCSLFRGFVRFSNVKNGSRKYTALIATSFLYATNAADSKCNVGLTTKWLQSLLLGGNDKIRDRLFANPIEYNETSWNLFFFFF